MDLAILHKAIGILLADNPERGDEPVVFSLHGSRYQITGVTVVVESDEWVPDTIVATVESIEDDVEEDSS